MHVLHVPSNQPASAATFTNGTTKATAYQLPSAQRDGSNTGEAVACCLPFHGDVAAFDVQRYNMYSEQGCAAASRVCGSSLPAHIQSVWVCGCAGGDCSGALGQDYVSSGVTV